MLHYSIREGTPVHPKGAGKSDDYFFGKLNPALADAVELGHPAGLRMVACHRKSKKPAHDWRYIRSRKQTRAEAFSQFDSADMNAAAVMGGPSRGIAVLDFDDREAYHRWAADHPADAARIPRVKTARGYHLWFRMNPATRKAVRKALRCPASGRHAGAIKLPYGELRADSGCLTMLPGSTHESGHEYAWDGKWKHDPPMKLTAYPVIDPIAVGLIDSRLPEVITPGAEVALPDKPTADFAPVKSVDDAIARSLPTQPGERNACVFQFARMLKTLDGIRDLPAADIHQLEPIVQRWHARAIRCCRTKRWGTTWADFRHAWKNAKPYTRGSLRDAVAYANGGERLRLPDTVEDRDGTRERLLKVCLHLQRQRGELPLFLAVRDAAQAIGLKVTTAWRRLRDLVRAGALLLVRKGKVGNKRREHSGEASEYRVADGIEPIEEPIEAGEEVEDDQKTPDFQGWNTYHEVVCVGSTRGEPSDVVRGPLGSEPPTDIGPPDPGDGQYAPPDRIEAGSEVAIEPPVVAA